MIPSAKPYFMEADIKPILSEIEGILRGGKLTSGEKIAAFENKYAEYIGSGYAVAVNSGTCTLEIILRYYGVEQQEVIVPTNSFVASANSVYFAGGTPVLADIREDTLCLDPADVNKKITGKTKAVMVVHIAGLPCPQMEELRQICTEKGLILIEDAAQAHGALWHEKKVGNLSEAASFSLYSTKVLAIGEGGMITTGDQKLADYARSVRNHGNENDRFVRLGHNWRMTEIQALLGLYQLGRLEQYVQKRNEVAGRYRELLADLKTLRFIDVPAGARHSYYKFPVVFGEPIDTVKVMSVMRQKYQIALAPLYYPPIHLQPFYRSLGYREGMLPVAERVLKQQLCLPMYYEITEQEIGRVADSLRQCLKELA